MTHSKDLNSKKNIYLFQPQYANVYNDKVTYWLPYSIGCLASYVSQFEHIQSHFDIKELFFKRDQPSDVVQSMESPSVCGFSCYMWNEQYCLAVAKAVKEKWPGCLIVFGGEQVNLSFLEHDFIDSVAQYEGEQNFLEILECVIEDKPVPKTFPKRRLDELNYPSPYTTGMFDKLIQDNPDAKWNMIFETNRGCPFSCTFCNWGSLTQSKIKKFNLHRVMQDLEWCVGKPITYLLCADANFGIFKERDLEIARMIKQVASKSEIDAVNLQYTKNSNDTVFQIAQDLDHLSRGITVSVQSMNAHTLEAIKRTNMAFGNIRHVMQTANKYQVKTYSEMILGLPLETLETWKSGLCELLEVGQHDSIDVWLAQLLQNSELADESTRQKYKLQSVIASDYLTINNYNYWDDIPEQLEIVNQTSTMTTKDMAEGYVYAWMIMHFHINGYSQIFSKYLNKVKDIRYSTYYDLLWQEIFTNKQNPVYKHVQELYTTIFIYLSTGKMNKKKYRGHNLIIQSNQFLYSIKADLFVITQKILDQLCENYPSNLLTLQKNLLLDTESNYPITLDFEYDISNNWQPQDVQISIDARMKDYKNYNWYAQRRQNLLKNKIEVKTI